jgi:CTD small phosphatase-like protein 2
MNNLIQTQQSSSALKLLNLKFLSTGRQALMKTPHPSSSVSAKTLKMPKTQRENRNFDQDSNAISSRRNSFEKENINEVQQKLSSVKEFLSPSSSNYFTKIISMPSIEKHRKTLILDLDETLVHSFYPELGKYMIKNDKDVCFTIRPFARELLKFAAQRFEVIVFTASRKEYADKILDFLDLGRELVSLRIYREHCITTEIGYVKDLRIFHGRSLDKMILVDNSLISAAYQMENLIPIMSWYGDENDRELLKLINFLGVLSKIPDVRPWLRSTFGLSTLN